MKSFFEKIKLDKTTISIRMRILGADITDYFNYGFTEETWIQYCDRQRRLRNETVLARHNPVHVKLMK